MFQDIEDLVTQIERLDDYEEASSALMEVVRREPERGAQLALDILQFNKGDVYLRAFAFHALYVANLKLAFEFIRDNFRTCESEVFVAMLEEVADDVGLVNESLELRDMVAFLRESVSSRPDLDNTDVKSGIEEFISVYNSHGWPL